LANSPTGSFVGVLRVRLAISAGAGSNDCKTAKDYRAEQQKQIDALTAGLQKVSAQLELSKPAPQVVNNP
jgi:hypothetical protein